MGDCPKVEFAVGSEVSPGHFKSSFARSFATSCRETKSLDFAGLFGNGTIAEEPECNLTADGRNNNFVSQNGKGQSVKDSRTNGDTKLWKISEVPLEITRTAELDKLRKQCQMLTEENRRLQNTLAVSQAPRTQVIDNVLLQTQIDTLQWQLKQTETNRQMYRALMEQVVRFLDRAHKSLDILHEKANPKTSKASRVPRSRSVHAVDASPNRLSSPASSSFTRAKSVTQISPPTVSTFRDFTWSVLRRNETVHCTPPRSKPPQDLNQTYEGVVYRRKPKQSEADPDDIPPEKLSQEAFRLMRTAQSLLATREPDLARLSVPEDAASSPSPSDHDLSLPPSFANSTPLHDSSFSGCSSSDRGSSGTESDRGCFRKMTNVELHPGARRSLDATSLHSGSSKTTEEEDVAASVLEREFAGTPTSTPIRRKTSVDGEVRIRTKAAASVSSAEDESGFSSMSSFQDVGLPPALSPIKGCHTEVGLPEVPLDKVRHRRWSSTPAEMQALFNGRYNASFSAAKPTNDTLRVLWV